MTNGEQKLVSEVHILLYPYFLYPMQSIALTSSIFMTVAIAFERCNAIRKPFNHRYEHWNFFGQSLQRFTSYYQIKSPFIQNVIFVTDHQVFMDRIPTIVDVSLCTSYLSYSQHFCLTYQSFLNRKRFVTRMGPSESTRPNSEKIHITQFTIVHLSEALPCHSYRPCCYLYSTTEFIVQWNPSQM